MSIEDVALLLHRLETAEAKVRRVDALLESWRDQHSHLGIEIGNWGPPSSALAAALEDQ